MVLDFNDRASLILKFSYAKIAILYIYQLTSVSLSFSISRTIKVLVTTELSFDLSAVIAITLIVFFPGESVKGYSNFRVNFSPKTCKGLGLSLLSV